jgi:hypothetical protein
MRVSPLTGRICGHFLRQVQQNDRALLKPIYGVPI